MAKLFLSYRRDDGAAYVHLMDSRFRARFGDANVFLDVRSVHPGQDFTKAIVDTLASCDVLVAVIGKAWCGEGRRGADSLLHAPADYVRLELETALDLGVQIVPVLVDGAQIPVAADLPESLQAVRHRNAVELIDSRLEGDVERLAEQLAGIAAASPVGTDPTTPDPDSTPATAPEAADAAAMLRRRKRSMLAIVGIAGAALVAGLFQYYSGPTGPLETPPKDGPVKVVPPPDTLPQAVTVNVELLADDPRVAEFVWLELDGERVEPGPLRVTGDSELSVQGGRVVVEAEGDTTGWRILETVGVHIRFDPYRIEPGQTIKLRLTPEALSQYERETRLAPGYFEANLHLRYGSYYKPLRSCRFRFASGDRFGPAFQYRNWGNWDLDFPDGLDALTPLRLVLDAPPGSARRDAEFCGRLPEPERNWDSVASLLEEFDEYQRADQRTLAFRNPVLYETAAPDPLFVAVLAVPDAVNSSSPANKHLLLEHIERVYAEGYSRGRWSDGLLVSVPWLEDRITGEGNVAPNLLSPDMFSSIEPGNPLSSQGAIRTAQELSAQFADSAWYLYLIDQRNPGEQIDPETLEPVTVYENAEFHRVPERDCDFHAAMIEAMANPPRRAVVIRPLRTGAPDTEDARRLEERLSGVARSPIDEAGAVHVCTGNTIPTGLTVFDFVYHHYNHYNVDREEVIEVHPLWAPMLEAIEAELPARLFD
jgi:hypothetical protein